MWNLRNGTLLNVLHSYSNHDLTNSPKILLAHSKESNICTRNGAEVFAK